MKQVEAVNVMSRIKMFGKGIKFGREITTGISYPLIILSMLDSFSVVSSLVRKFCC